MYLKPTDFWEVRDIFEFLSTGFVQDVPERISSVRDVLEAYNVNTNEQEESVIVKLKASMNIKAEERESFLRKALSINDIETINAEDDIIEDILDRIKGAFFFCYNSAEGKFYIYKF